MSLVATLASIAARVAVKQLLAGITAPFDEMNDVATDVVGAIVDESFRIVDAGPQISPDTASWIRQYNRHMIAGRRFLMDLPDEWRQMRDKDEMIVDARREFVRASATAEEAGDLFRSAQAEAAIAGCWLCVPSMMDVRKTLVHAGELVKYVTAKDSAEAITAWAEVHQLCHAYNAPFAAEDVDLIIHHLAWRLQNELRSANTPFAVWIRQN